MLTANEQRSGLLATPGPKKLQIVIEGPSLEEVQGAQAKDMAVKLAAEHGFANAGMCNLPAVGAFHATTGEFLDDANAFVPGTPVGGYRVEYTFAQRL